MLTNTSTTTTSVVKQPHVLTMVELIENIVLYCFLLAKWTVGIQVSERHTVFQGNSWQPALGSFSYHHS